MSAAGMNQASVSSALAGLFAAMDKKKQDWVEQYHKHGFHVRSDKDPPILIAPDKDDKIPDPDPPVCAPHISEIESDRYWSQPGARYLYDLREARWNRFIRSLVTKCNAVPRQEDVEWLQKAGCMESALPMPPAPPPKEPTATVVAVVASISPDRKRKADGDIGSRAQKQQRTSSSPMSQLAQKTKASAASEASKEYDPGMHGGQPVFDDIEDDADAHNDVDARLVRPQSQVRVPLKLESVAPSAAAAVAPNASLEETLFFANPARDTHFMRERIVVLACQVRHAQKLANANAERGFVSETSKYTRVEQAASRALVKAVDQFIETARFAYTELDEVAISDRF